MGLLAVSDPEIARPLRSGICIVRKYSGPTIKKSADGRVDDLCGACLRCLSGEIKRGAVEATQGDARIHIGGFDFRFGVHVRVRREASEG